MIQQVFAHTRAVIAHVFGLMLLATGLSSQAFVSYRTDSGQPQKWNLTNPSPLVHTNVLNRTTRAVRYYLAADAYSSANRSVELDAARACFDQWQAVPGSILRFEQGGLMPWTLDVNTTDNTNVVFWAKNTTVVNGGFDNISGATGVTFSDYFSDGTLAEADIVLNGRQFSWFTDFDNTVNQAQFIESVLLHEIGHMIGLAHSPAGGTTMFPRGGGGVSVQAGLSADEIAAVRALYPSGTTPPTGRLSGRVTKGDSPVFGAVVSVEDSAGNIAGCTVTESNGRYDVPAIPPGDYQVRVTPIDPSSASYSLLRGQDIAASFATADHQFLPTPNESTRLIAGRETTLNFAVIDGTAGFRIGRLWPATRDTSIKVVVNYPVAIPAGAEGWVIGVYSSQVPAAGTLLRITGGDVTLGPTTIEMNAFPGVNPPLNLISVSFNLSPHATPGLRSLIVQNGDFAAYANGFLEVSPPFPDFNFDGLDDRFQRSHFSLWTAVEAAPSADPDRDGYSNAEEYLAGSNPADAASFLEVESVRFDEKGATLKWRSAPGKRYRVFRRPRVDSPRGWQPIGDPVLASGDEAEFLDASIAAQQQFYRVQAVP